MRLQETSKFFSQSSPFQILFFTFQSLHPRFCERRSAFTPYSSLFLQICISFLLVPKQITICLVASNNTDLLYHSYVIQKSGHSQYQLDFCFIFHQAKSKCELDCILFGHWGKICFQAYSGDWPNLFPCAYRTKVLFPQWCWLGVLLNFSRLRSKFPHS